ncbi:DUF805 domain-containing protein [Shewanella pneumatophori]|uniref:DUF805 domain-containing protein n=1 Tax=Shewanella pneumatophori TaxID=314092 RepID=A0A9X1ZAM9_9GAMM|nr:DUF805 domain-containing protein [Shewanella pneumatophori]MCL1138026.1 DUF805 domain-containing protein [Shewanella pneumatophori]
MQIKSLFCVVGLDNSKRFSVISSLIYLALFISVALIGPSGLLYVPALVLAPILALTSLRRLRDSGKPALFTLVTLLPFILVIITLVHIQSMMLLLTFLLLAVLTIGYLAIQPAISNADYVQGYSGPVEMKETARPMRKENQRSRVEPTLGGGEPSFSAAINASDENADVVDYSADVQRSAATSTETESRAKFDTQPSSNAEPANNTYQQDRLAQHRRHRGSRQAQPALGQLQQFIEANKKGVLIGAGGIVGSMLLISLWTLIPSSEQEDVNLSVADDQVITEAKVERISTAMPDDFSLALEDDVLIMRWLGDSGAPENLWSLATAKGDRTCSRLRFNNGTEYRPLVVNLLADTGTEARFSPLDTEAIVIDMARRGNVSLCGYNFSLKGSQAALGKVAAFRDYL